MTHIHAKGQGQRELASKVRVETDRRMEVIVLPPMLARLITMSSSFETALSQLNGMKQNLTKGPVQCSSDKMKQSYVNNPL